MPSELPAEFVRNNNEMLAAAKRCIELGQVVPALVLMYSQVDALAWSCAEDSRGKVKANFVSWTEAWLLPHLHRHVPDLAGIDLYAARCGVLHTLTGVSDLSVAGRVKSMGYARGTADAAGMNENIARERPDVGAKFVMVHLDWLHAALGAAFAAIQTAALTDAGLRRRIERAGSHQFVRFPTDAAAPPQDSRPT